VDEMTEEPYSLEEDAPTSASSDEKSAFAEKLSAIKSRCDVAKIDFSYFDGFVGTPVGQIEIQSGRSKRNRYVVDEASADRWLAVRFEKYRFISGYDAIVSYEDGVIEAGITGQQGAGYIIVKRVLERLSGNKETVEAITLTPPVSERPTIIIGPSSPEFEVFSERPGQRFTIRLQSSRVKQHDQALAELRSYSDSLFFEIDAIVGIPLFLESERRALSIRSPRNRDRIELAYPLSHYNEEAISLFWYAKSARDMPLLRFLAFYQSVEFYFPRYSLAEARKRVSSILKQPSFRPNRNDDVDRVISAIQTSRGGTLGSEQSQLRAVVNECIGADDIRQYLTATKQREEHFAGKASKYHKIPLANKTADLRNDVADRIYDIRCKIVHTKNEHSDDNHPMILPFSEDAHYLLHDIDLAEFVARSVLVYSSDELS